MQYATLGTGGPTVSRLCLGTMQFGWTADEAASFAVLDAFAEAGGTFLDSADIYSYWLRGNHGGESERMLGKWLKARGGRDRFVIATKARGRMWPGPTGDGLSRAHLVRACEESLRRLGVETLDLYQFHWPDEATPIDESLRAIEELVQAGKVRFVGCSNYNPVQLKAALDAAEQAGLPRFVSLQPHHNLLHRDEWEGELQALCIERRVGVIPYSPLAKGLLTGKYRRDAKPAGARASGFKEYLHDGAWDTIEGVAAIAAKHGVPPAAIALAWELAQPGLTAPIVGANSVAQLQEQLAALDLKLPGEELEQLSRLSAPPGPGGGA